jgi:hypothetical protein
LASSAGFVSVLLPVFGSAWPWGLVAVWQATADHKTKAKSTCFIAVKKLSSV